MNRKKETSKKQPQHAAGWWGGKKNEEREMMYAKDCCRVYSPTCLPATTVRAVCANVFFRLRGKTKIIKASTGSNPVHVFTRSTKFDHTILKLVAESMKKSTQKAKEKRELD